MTEGGGMRIAALEAFGLDERIIELWQASGHERLLPIQTQAVRKGKVLDGRHAVVFSPTSSGKTFVGELAAVKTARQNRRVIYLVPQKALAEEKFQEFQRKYAGFGIRVAVSTRDRKEFDQDIRQGRFHIGVIVFEKMHALLVAQPSLLRNVGLVVIDELQLLGDKSRGPELEILLTKIKTAASKPQIIGLSAVLGNDEKLAEWLGATLCRSKHRPVELRKGVLFKGTFYYVEHNGGKKGKEVLHKAEEKALTKLQTLVEQVVVLAEQGEQSLVFCKSRNDCVTYARMIARQVQLKGANGALEDLRYLEDSEGKDLLADLLENGVAYHNADLDWDQRDLVERHFRQGEIRVVCATSTLAMGINLPTRNVFVEPEKWEQDHTGRFVTVPLSQGEYENISGRAGRLNLEKEYGRAILVAESEFEARTFYDSYVKGTLGDVEPALARSPLAQHALNLVASQLCRTEREIKQLLLSSYTGETCWKGGERETEFQERLREGVQHGLEGGLLELRRGKLEATALGKIAASKGVAVDTAIAMAQFAKEHAPHASSVHLFELLWCLSGTEDGQAIHFNLSKTEHDSFQYEDMLARLLQKMGKQVRARAERAAKGGSASYEHAKRLKKTLLLYGWVVGMPTREIEVRFHCYSGSIAGLASEYAWLSEMLAGVAKIQGWPDEQVTRLENLARQVIHGVPVEGVPLTAARVRGFGRGRIMGLLKEGFASLEKLVGAPVKQVEKLLTKPVARRVLERARHLLQIEELREQEPQDTAELAAESEDAPWTKEFPPADDMGVAFRGTATLELDGSAKERRHLVRVNGKEAWLTEQSFDALLKLACAALTTELGWLPSNRLDSDSCHQVVKRLKEQLAVNGESGEVLIENNKAKQYRLSVPRMNIRVQIETVRRHYPAGEEVLAQLTPGLTSD